MLVKVKDNKEGEQEMWRGARRCAFASPYLKKKKEKTTSMKDRHPKEKKKYTEGEGQEESS